jgi:hypothetical protein
MDTADGRGWEDIDMETRDAIDSAYEALATLDTAIATLASTAWSTNQGHEAWALMRASGKLTQIIHDAFNEVDLWAQNRGIA